MIDNLLSWWNLLSPEDRVKVIAGALATILIGILTFFSNSIVITIKRVFTKNEPAPASTAQATQHMSQSQQVIVNIPPQPIIIREEPLPRGEGAGDHAGSPLHTAPIPRTGGIAMAAAFAVAVIFAYLGGIAQPREMTLLLGIVLGNLFRQSLAEIWWGPRYLEFRDAIQTLSLRERCSDLRTRKIFRRGLARRFRELFP